MTPQEFRQEYLEMQDQVGNNLQSLTSLSNQFNIAINELIGNYNGITTMLEAFLNELESQPADEE